MTQKKLFAALMAIATQNPDGFTVSAQDLNTVKTGWAVAVHETQNSFGPDGLKRVINYVSTHDVNAYGGWLDSETGAYYFDATIIVNDFQKAVELAKVNKQKAIFNLDTLTEYRIK